VKSMVFILVAQLHAGGVQTVAAYPNLEQCRNALKVRRPTSRRTTNAKRRPWRGPGRKKIPAT